MQQIQFIDLFNQLIKKINKWNLLHLVGYLHLGSSDAWSYKRQVHKCQTGERTKLI
jgi:hypothetical protein